MQADAISWQPLIEGSLITINTMIVFLNYKQINSKWLG